MLILFIFRIYCPLTADFQVSKSVLCGSLFTIFNYFIEGYLSQAHYLICYGTYAIRGMNSTLPYILNNLHTPNTE